MSVPKSQNFHHWQQRKELSCVTRLVQFLSNIVKWYKINSLTQWLIHNSLIYLPSQIFSPSLSFIHPSHPSHPSLPCIHPSCRSFQPIYFIYQSMHPSLASIVPTPPSRPSILFISSVHPSILQSHFFLTLSLISLRPILSSYIISYSQHGSHLSY